LDFIDLNYYTGAFMPIGKACLPVMSNEKGERILAICTECQSEYNSESSAMQALCPDCAHWLYGHPNCPHQIEKGRCKLCYWNGNSSDYVKKLKVQ
jgi:predicted RNA-binding Zn-ribbon protein involved in translation (DUF1610 family)